MGCREYGPDSFDDLKAGCDWYERRPHYTDTLRRFRERIRTNAGLRGSDNKLDLSRLRHRVELVNWLNQWGCMLPKTNREHRRRTLCGLGEWWQDCAGRLPDVGLKDFGALAAWSEGVRDNGHRIRDCNLRPAPVADLIDVYSRLSSVDLGPRHFAPVAASKALFALRPGLFVAWDNKMMNTFGYRDGSPERYALFLDDVRAVLKKLERCCLPQDTALDALPELLGERHNRCTLPEIVNKYLFARARGFEFGA